MTSQATSEDFFLDSSLISVSSEKKKSTRENPSKRPEVWQFGSMDFSFRKCEMKNATKDQKTTKDPQPATLNNHMRGMESINDKAGETAC